MAKCDKCENEATVQETTIRNGVRVERKLCESCAASAGLQAQSPGQVNVAELLKSTGLGQVPGLVVAISGPTSARGSVCARCKLTFADFRSTGQLGCPECYTTFEAQLVPMLERAHEGSSLHVGKSPKPAKRSAMEEVARAKAAMDSAERMQQLRRQLDEAVKAEAYELAARIRDQLRALGG
ncbi:MAG: UvrB/UvrC motif-containing protein [Planctomycetota bacterium]|nr:UvrB/UvrC motif-containing protein [Planctomycetota bacterium]